MTDTRDRWLQMGVSKTVYSLPFPEVRQLTARAMDPPEKLISLHDAPWTRRQDSMHAGFVRAWAGFADKAGVEIPESLLAHAYPCAGASEAIRETLALLASRGRGLVVFEGEYEGFEAIARPLGMRVAKIPRARFADLLPGLFASGHELFLSNPSSIDGNHWPGLPDCMALAERCSGLVHLDLSYVGCCELSTPISADSPACASVFFSLSKVFGVYYRRIGGCLSRAPHPLLAGNLWFKNLDSLAIGEELLRTFGPGELPRAWARQRAAAMLRASASLGAPLRGSDVFLLACSDHPSLSDFVRAPTGPARVCITPALAAAIDSAEEFAR